MSATIAIPYASSKPEIHSAKRKLYHPLSPSRRRHETRPHLFLVKEEEEEPKRPSPAQEQQEVKPHHGSQVEWSNTYSPTLYRPVSYEVSSDRVDQNHTSFSTSSSSLSISSVAPIMPTTSSLATPSAATSSSANKFGPTGPHLSPTAETLATNTARLKNNIFQQMKRKKILVLDIDECIIHSEFLSSNENSRSQNYRPNDSAIAFKAANSSSITTTCTPTSLSPSSLASKESCGNSIFSSSSSSSSLSHSTEAYPDSFIITMCDGEKAIIYKRPGLDLFLESVSRYYDIFAYSAGLQMYGQPILDCLDPQHKFFKKAFFRPHCILSSSGIYLKDLRLITDDLNHVILVDNNPVSFLLQPQNGIPVPSFYDNAKDKTLEALWKVLDYMKDMHDVRPILHRMFHLKDLLADYQKYI